MPNSNPYFEIPSGSHFELPWATPAPAKVPPLYEEGPPQRRFGSALGMHLATWPHAEIDDSIDDLANWRLTAGDSRDLLWYILEEGSPGCDFEG